MVVDGMVLDVKRWLPEHPGGDKIIPAQSLNAEAARHFELYHSSRESFLYLKHFYVGEVFADDRASVPLVPGPPAVTISCSNLRVHGRFPRGRRRVARARGNSRASRRERRDEMTRPNDAGDRTTRD